MPRNRPRAQIRAATPSGDAGTPKGMMFQIKEQIREKEKDLSRIKGDLAYLFRCKQKLEKEILHKKGGSKKGKR